MDYDVILALAVRDTYERFARFIKRSSLSKEAYIVFEALGDWFKNNPAAKAVDWSKFSAWFTLVRHAKMSSEQLDTYRGLLAMLSTRKVEGSVDSLMEGLTRRDYFTRIGEAALRGADGDYSVKMDDLQGLLESYKEEAGKLDSLERDLGEFSVERLDGTMEGGLQWRMRCLQLSCGPVRKGDLTVFAARPDSGKTTWLASEATAMAAQLKEGESVLWLNNEEQGDKVRRRIVQAAIGWTTDEMQEDMEAAMQEYDRVVGDRQKIRVFDRSKIHTKDVETLCKRYKPKLIIMDQLRKFHGFDNEAEHERQTLLYNWARELAKEYAPVINVTQLGAVPGDMRWIPMDMIYGAKTGPQGEADCIITMARLDGSGPTRYIYVPKNKLLTPGDPSLRNGKHEVILHADTAQWEEAIR